MSYINMIYLICNQNVMSYKHIRYTIKMRVKIINLKGDENNVLL